MFYIDFQITYHVTVIYAFTCRLQRFIIADPGIATDLRKGNAIIRMNEGIIEQERFFQNIFSCLRMETADGEP